MRSIVFWFLNTILVLAEGSLVSAIDPVATLSVFGDLNAPPLLYNLVFGESVLNDAVSVVLFRTFQGFLGKEISFVTVFWVVGKHKINSNLNRTLH